MSTTLLPPDDTNADESKKPLKRRKGKTIEPLGKTATGGGDVSIPGASDDLLEELRKKTAALAAELHAGADEKPAEPLDISSGAEEKALNNALLNELEQKDAPAAKTPSKKANGTPDELPAVNPAVAMVRDKLDRIYKKEPDATEEALEAYEAGSHRSKHQAFMYNLTTSGKSLAEIQTEWHAYYASLPEDEKHQVWQEFYASQSSIRGKKHKLPSVETPKSEKKTAKKSPAKKSQAKTKKSDRKVAAVPRPAAATAKDPRTAGEIKRQIVDTISAGGKLNAVHHAKSLLFGIGLSALVLLITSFIFFNEAYIAPFISPGQNVSATPIIGDHTTDVGPEPKIIIPKINLEVPVVFGMNSIREEDVQNALEDGVVHYASTPNPGEIGNSVIVGHSSNNILNSGKYKFAFVLLRRLEPEDTFFVHREGIRYTYKVYKKEVVGPSELSVLQTQERPNTMTLITCDPPGTTINRLIITAEQISPDPGLNTASTAPDDIIVDEEEALPSNAPSLWSRLWPF